MRAILFTGALLLVTAANLSAQDRLFTRFHEVGAVGRFGQDLGRAPADVHAPLIGGGRFLVTGSGAVNTRTGAFVWLGPGFLVGYDRARPRVFMARADGVWDVDVETGIEVLVLPGPTFDLIGCVHATSADVPLCAFVRGDGQHELVRPGPLGPVSVLVTRFASIAPLNWVITPEGSRVYFAGCTRVSTPGPGGVCLEADIARFDLRNGELRFAGQSGPLSALGVLQWDEANERLFSVASVIDVFAEDLTRLVRASVPGTCRQLAISPHTARLYLLMGSGPGASGSALQAFDARSYAALTSAVSRAGDEACGPLTLATAPGRPRDLSAIVAGRDVTLTWTNIGAASNFVLDVGYTSQRVDFSIPLGVEPRVTFAGVPPGTYHLRVRGGNLLGGGLPSAVLTVTVR